MVVKPNKFQYIIINRLGKLEDSCKLKVDNSSVIKRKGESQSGYFKDDTAQQIFRKTKLSYPAHVSGSEEFFFLGKFGMLCFFEVPIFRFSLLSYYRQVAQKSP